jgi:DNA-binding NarL/FixJ family response regulator
VTTVLLVDYPLAVRQALRARLSLEPELGIVGEADDAPQAISLAQSLDPDVILLDAEMPDLDASTVVRALTEQDGRRGVVVLSQHTPAMLYRLQGTRAIVVGKHEGLASLIAAIRAADRRSAGR